MKKSSCCSSSWRWWEGWPRSRAAADAPQQATPTFYKDVLPILQDKCQTCHRPGGANLGGMVAPMSFVDYKETRAWAKSIAKQVDAEDDAAVARVARVPWRVRQRAHAR